jgi:hypothetical protein
MQMKDDVLGQLVTVSAACAEPNFEHARDLARQQARRFDPQAMLLSWHSALTGEYYPVIECGRQDRPPWIVWAASRGANLTVSVNNGAFTFYYLIGILADRRTYSDSCSVP